MIRCKTYIDLPPWYKEWGQVKGAAHSAAQSTDMDIITYQLTEAGAALQATLQGTKYWKHKDLN
ncbi:MAG TPA: hypothetical protein QF423_01935 [Candidatus Scalindua sp.]|nr:hypothetical protein [Candidatus Scalindua sp.]